MEIPPGRPQIAYFARGDQWTLHLCAFIDHYSKLVPRGAWYRSEQIATLEHCFKQAILTRGCPDGV